MSDIFTAADDESKRSLLRAQALDGNLGRKRLEQQKQAVEASRKVAIAQMLAGQAQRGAPAALGAETLATVAAPALRAESALASNAGAFDQAERLQRQAMANYAEQITSAVPIIRAQAAKAAKTQQSELSDSELGTRLRGMAELEAENARAKAIESQTTYLGARESARTARLGAPRGAHGTGIARANESDFIRDAGIPQATTAYQQAGAAHEAIATETEQDKAHRTRRLGVAQGVDPTRVYGVIGVPEPDEAKDAKPSDLRLSLPSAARAVGIPVPVAEQVRGRVGEYKDGTEGRVFDDTLETFQAMLDSGLSPEEADAEVASRLRAAYGADDPEARRLARAMLGLAP